MPKSDYAKIRVLVFDPSPAQLQHTRRSLFELGIGEVDGLRTYDEFSRRLETGSFELAIVEAFSEDGDACAAVKRLRAGELGGNPFLVVILTSWRKEVADIRTAIDSGADDVLLKPFSVNQLSARIDALVAARKDFVVTGDYIGPDRRKDKDRGKGGVTPIVAPNALRAVAKGDVDELQRIESAIAETRSNVDKERIKRLSMRVATAARLRIEAGGEADMFGLEEIDRAARELRRRLKANGAKEAAGLATTLTQVTARLIQEKAASPDDLTLANELSFAAYAAFSGESENGRTKAEVEAVVAAVRKRLAKQPASPAAG